MDRFEEFNNFPRLEVFTQRKDGKLYLINKGCGVLVGIIAPKGDKFIIEGYSDEFDSEADAKDILMRGL